MLKKIASHPLFYYALLSCVVIAFLFMAFTYAHRLPSRVDEGSFLIKGFFYIKGIYQPFEEYGPWTNNMPLAYYIPGIAQALFGPGLQTGRYFMVFLTLLTFTALFLLVNRLKGKWWAIFAILPLAINPSMIVMYVQAVSEGIVACLLSWMMFFLIGKERKDWQIAAGALLCALTILTRQNMILLAPFAVAYAFWLHGKRAGWIALLFAGAPLIIGHLIYYPDIFTLWFSWLPRFIKRAFQIKGLEGGGTQAWQPDVEFFNRIASFFISLRYHFVSLTGFFFALVMLPLKSFWKSNHDRKLVFLLALTFISFFGLHAWASLTKNYCVFCFPNYVSFFIPMAVIAGMISINNFFKSGNEISPLPMILFSILAIPGTFLGCLESVGRWVMALPFPRVKEGKILSGAVELWKLFENRFGWSYEKLLRFIPPAFGFIFSVLLLALLIGGYSILKKKNSIKFGNFLLYSILIFGIVFTPTYLLGRDSFGNQCSGDVLAAYENVGQELQKTIPPGSKVYWGAGSVVTPLLYITDTKIHPPQLNGIYSARRGGDRDLLEKAGYYNEESRHAWRAEDEFFLISYTSLNDFWREFLEPELFNEYQPTSPLDPCDPDSFIRIYRRK